MRTIAVLNQKGGVGKTTTVVNTAAALAAMGKRVVAVDLDPQAHLTIHLGIEPETISAGAYRVLTQSGRFEQEIMMTRLNLWILPSNIDLVGAETELVSVVGRETILREALSRVEDKFDYCLIDCPPSLGLLTLNALAAAQEVLIPLQAHFLALQGFGKLLKTVDLVNKRINPGLKVKGIVLCMYDSRPSLSNEVRTDIEQFLQNARGTNCAWAEAEILPTCIRRNIKLAEAPSYGKTIFEYEQNCHGAEDYLRVACYIHGIEVSDEPGFQRFNEDETEQDADVQSDVATEVAPAPEPQAQDNPPDTADAPDRSETPSEPIHKTYPIPPMSSDIDTKPAIQSDPRPVPPYQIRPIPNTRPYPRPLREKLADSQSEQTSDQQD